MAIRLIPAKVVRLFKPRDCFRIIAMDRIAPRVVRVRLAPESGTVRPYRAGQFLYIRFNLPGLPRKDFRFTIANPPGGSYLEILVKGTNESTLAVYDRSGNFPGPQAVKAGSGLSGPEPTGARKAWMAWLDYPFGGFTAEGACTGPWVFLAAGIGIAPFLAMTGDKLRDDARVLVIWAAHNRDELAGFEQLSAINARRPSIRMVPVLGHDPLWTGRQGHLDRQALLDLAGAELADPRTCYWICCPTPLRRSLIQALKSLGVPGKNLRYEVFS